MINELILIGIVLVFLSILIARYSEAIPHLIFWITARNITSDDFTTLTPNQLGLTAEFVEIPMKKRPLNVWFFPSESASTAGILIVPNWYQKDDHENNLKTVGILHTAGYNVLLPAYHLSSEDGEEFKFEKRSVGPKQCQKLIDKAYDYLISRPDIDKRKIGVWSNVSGTILACQLIKNSPIKAVVLENGPITLWNDIATKLHEKRYFPYLLTKILLILTLFPFIWRTRWESKGAVKNLRTCPSFLIASRANPRKNFWQIFSNLHKPRQLWFEHALNPRAMRDTWLQEYFMQIHLFYDIWILDSPQPEFHYDFSVKRKKGNWQVEITLLATPPQLDNIPIQIILSDNSYVNELRIWFTGASARIIQTMKFKPNNISVIQFLNVEPGEYPHRKWLKRDARKALFTTIEKLIQYPPEELNELIERYFFLKSIILNEQEQKEEAKETLQTSITSKHWKTMIGRDSDSQIIIQEDFEEPQISIADGAFMTK